MARINPGRFTHQHDGDLTVFVIGMRVNHWWRVRAWWPAFMAMGPMIGELSKDPDSGFLGARYLLGPGGPTLVQYWASTDHLYAYASDRTAKHRPAWSAFNARARRYPGAVGVWHETYQVAAAESMYVDMPTMGLAQATSAVEVTAATHTAAKRLEQGTHTQ